MSDLTAIDVLINPDDATIERARKVNARMLESMPEGWFWMTHTSGTSRRHSAICAPLTSTTSTTPSPRPSRTQT
jgi:hypothetical protein